MSKYDIPEAAVSAAAAAYSEAVADLRLKEGGGFMAASQHRRALEVALTASYAAMFSGASIERVARARYMAQRHVGDQWVWEDQAESVKDKWREPLRETLAAMMEAT